MTNAKFVSIDVAGFVWLAVETNGRRHLLHKQGKIGDLIRPGQKAGDL